MDVVNKGSMRFVARKALDRKVVACDSYGPIIPVPCPENSVPGGGIVAACT